MIGNEVFCELMCRACLCTGRLYNIHEYQLADSFIELIGTKMLSHDGLPQHLCAMCSTMLLKFKEFRQQCVKTQLLLDDIKKRHNLITFNSIPENISISKKYCQTLIKITEYPKINSDRDSLYVYHHDIEPIKKDIELYVDNLSMKIEENSTDNNSSQLYIDQVHTNYEINDINEAELVEHNADLQKEKLELELKKTGDTNISKNTKNKDISEPVKKAVKINVNIKNDSEKKERKPEFNRAVKTSKMKGKYFETKENMSNFECMYDVEIVVLSKEQQLSDVMDRKTSLNYLNSSFKCQYCFKGFTDDVKLTKHYKSQHDPSRGDVVCEFCQFRYKDMRGLNQHLKSHRLKFVCKQCRYVSRTTFNAKEHYEMHNGQMHKCKECGKSYEKLSGYLIHMRAHHSAELAWCDLCGDAFVGEFGLNSHKKRAHRDVQYSPEWRCAQCGAAFTNSGALRVHGAGACGAASCAHCGQGFASRLLLRDHLATHRPSAPLGRFPCAKCDKWFERQNLYNAHYRRVHADPNTRRYLFVCELCGKRLPNQCELRYHQRTHTGERPFACPHCPKSFIKQAFLKAHMRVHSTERPFACKLCPKTFKGPAALSGHQYVHTGVKPPVRKGKKATVIIDNT